MDGDRTDTIRDRGCLNDLHPVIAIERGRTVWYRSQLDCCREYGIRSSSILSRYISHGQIGPDGYTTFDEPQDGVVYAEMTPADIEMFVGGRRR